MIQHRVRQTPATSPADIKAELDEARRVLQAESAGVRTVADGLDESFAHAVDVLAQCRGRVVVTGMGKAGWIGQKVSATLASTGSPSFFLHPAEALHGDLGRLSRDDVVLAFSHSGTTAEIVDLLGPLADREISIVAVTRQTDSPLGQASVAGFYYGQVEEACPIGMAPSTSCMVMLGLGDALAFSLMNRRAFDQHDFHHHHPAGALGRRSGPVESVMRKGPALRIAPASRTVAQVFSQTHQQGRRTGAIMLTHPDGTLAGLFTDSDLARLVESRDHLLFDQPIANVMTAQPITIGLSHRVEEAITILRDRHLSELPVLDDQRKPIGLVDITDILDLLPEAAA